MFGYSGLLVLVLVLVLSLSLSLLLLAKIRKGELTKKTIECSVKHPTH